MVVTIEHLELWLAAVDFPILQQTHLVFDSLRLANLSILSSFIKEGAVLGMELLLSGIEHEAVFVFHHLIDDIVLEPRRA